MASYIELDKNASFPASTDVGRLIFGFDTSSQIILNDNNGNNLFNLYPKTYDNIDVSSQYYVATTDGIYHILDSNPESYDFTFPDPSLFNGKSITVINTSASSLIINGTNAPYIQASNDIYTSFLSKNIYTFVSINGKWWGGSLAS